MARLDELPRFSSERDALLADLLRLHRRDPEVAAIVVLVCALHAVMVRRFARAAGAHLDASEREAAVLDALVESLVAYDVDQRSPHIEACVALDVRDRLRRGLLLAGAQVGEVYPEWWGAVSGGNPTITRLAIQAAFDAAHRHRLRPVRRPNIPPDAFLVSFRRMQSIPIVLSGAYLIDGELCLGASAADQAARDPLNPVNEGGFVLRGERAVTVGDGPTIRAQGAPWRGSLLSIRGPSGFTIKDCSFHGDFIAERCVEISVGTSGGMRSSFENCAFYKGRSELLKIDGIAQSLVSTPPDPLTFQRCRLVTAREDEAYRQGAVRHRHAESGEQLVGVRLDAGERVQAEFNNCFLTGCLREKSVDFTPVAAA